MFLKQWDWNSFHTFSVPKLGLISHFKVTVDGKTLSITEVNAVSVIRVQ